MKENKRCSVCKIFKSLDQFYKNPITKDRLGSLCKPCKSVLGMKYYNKNKHKINIRNIEYYYQHHERCKKANRGYQKKTTSTFKGRLYVLWSNINTRCNNPNSINYKYYGERGITNKFKLSTEFFEYVTIFLGYDSIEKLRGLQIDRIDNDGHYEPGNIRFITSKINNNNRRKRGK